jgi:hypothetical protein
MNTLWTALGYDRVADRIGRSLGDADIKVIQGPPGVGKSRLAEGIGEMWRDGGIAIVAEGDLLHSDVPLYPLGYAMSALEKGWAPAGSSLADAARSGERLAGTAGVISATARSLERTRRKRRRAHQLFLGEAEQRIVFKLERLSRRKPLLLIADNLHWWDPASLDLVRRLREPRVVEAFPFLTGLRLLAVQTPEPYQQVAHPEAHAELLADGATTYFELPRIARDPFTDVLVALGAPRAAAVEFGEVIFALSGGHLALADRCASRIKTGQVADFLKAADSDDFVRRLLTQRIRTLGTVGAEAVRLLQIAAVLGLQFRRSEILCATSGDDAQTARLLRYCRDEDVIEFNGDVGHFVHDVYRSHFMTSDAVDRAGIHETLSDCLRQIRPSDYEFRCQNALHAERPSEAARFGVHAALASQREGRSWRKLGAATLGAIEAGGMTGVVEAFQLILESANQYRYDECFHRIDLLPGPLPTSLQAEAAYLQAMCLMSTRGLQDRDRGRGILQDWLGYEATELEIGVRMMQMLLYGLTLLADKEPGKAMELRIKSVLSDRPALDDAARDAWATLDRCAGSLYEPETALIRTARAVAYYAPSDDEAVIRRPVEYYRCLVNWSSNLILSAQYTEALDAFERLEDLVAGHAPGMFPRLDYPQAGAVLAGYRAGRIDIRTAVFEQRRIVAEHEVPGDPFYVENALAAYLAIAGVPQDAVAVYDRLIDRLGEVEEPEASMAYLLRANRCAARYVAGARDEAHAEWLTLAPLLDSVPYVITKYLRRRHDLIATVMQDRPCLSGRQFDECVLARWPHEYGPFWDQLGRGFRMPEVEWWR